ncbi:prevent-host-death family protein [Erythromicrobium ramosum]|uniref:Prevent-host-death family protein n=1 Tax=Erythrobacter ramosus TaxID=35811 RepID=A0A6I4UQ25_9SPHN|nr:type II toxin-antitoxin system prevent-host-death family antitoxin [Erythrobacter ramosus]MBB3776871.1 prevent-host-death family protein [Erythrobacter ramosus]MXP39894.1 type II toxin-antitoxin system prevent-host-death family antitoxin [Erythrobacter ramosus]
MTSTTFSSQDFNREPGRIKKAAMSGPVFITDRRKPSLVVLTIKEYERLAGKPRSILAALALPNSADHDFDWEPPKATIRSRPADFEV